MPNETMELTGLGADGKEVKITVPAAAIYGLVKETHLPKDAVAADLDRRAQSIVKSGGYVKRDDLLADEAFVASVLEKHGKKANEGDGAAAQQLKDALARQAADLDAKIVGPLKKSLEEKGKRESSLLVRDLERQIIQHAAPYVRDGLLKAPGKNKPVPIVTLLEDAFAYDEETGEFYVADGDNFVISGSGHSTYKTVEEYVGEWLADPVNADWLKPGQGGAGATGQGSKGRPGDGSITLSAEEASDARVYGKALEKVGGDHSKIRVQRQGAF